MRTIKVPRGTTLVYGCPNVSGGKWNYVAPTEYEVVNGKLRVRRKNLLNPVRGRNGALYRGGFRSKVKCELWLYENYAGTGIIAPEARNGMVVEFVD